MSKSQSRSYKKGSPHRDFRKFIIIAEGEREEDYFDYFNSKNQRVQIEFVPREASKSAPKHFIERLIIYDEKSGIEKEDLIWFVLDVDRWKPKEIHELQSEAAKYPNGKIVISNPCFEVWLHCHFKGLKNTDSKTCRALKTALDKLVHGGYNRDLYAKEIRQAATNAKNCDANPTHYLPGKMQTKVYLLADELLKFLGNNWDK